MASRRHEKGKATAESSGASSFGRPVIQPSNTTQNLIPQSSPNSGDATD